MNEQSILPSIRPEIRAEEYIEDGRKYIYLTDPMNYATQPVSIPVEFLPLLAFLDGNYTLMQVRQIIEEDNPQENINEIMDSFLNLINFLDYIGYLQSSRFEFLKMDIDNYLSSDVRPAYCAGSSYSDKKTDLLEELKQIFSTAEPDDVKKGADTIIVPHIDFRIGKSAHKAYALGYYALRDKSPDLIVIFGTSHNGSTKRFILSEKDFATPLGVVQNERDIVKRIMDLSDENDEVIIDEIAHRNEHSIEFQVLLSQYFFYEKPFKILPILVNSFVGDIYKGILPDDDEKFNKFIRILKQVLKESDYNPVFIASVDMAHIGRKFDDNFDAENKIETLKKEDAVLIHYLASCNPDAYFTEVARVKDKNKICGLAPVYSILKFRKPRESRFLHYDIWHEIETKSAVSFSAFAFY